MDARAGFSAAAVLVAAAASLRGACRRHRAAARAPPQPPRVLLEICCDTIQSVRTAVASGADRVELCANLVDGGTTPSPGLIRAAVEAAAGSACRVNVLVRPRGGDFVYSPEELRVMHGDIRFCKRAGCNAVVVGVLDPAGQVNVQAMRRLVVTFHRAIDMAEDPVAAVAAVIASGCDKILTSGGAAAALDGAATVRAMARAARGRVAVIAAAGVTEDNASAILEACGPQCRELHGSLRHAVASSMVFRKRGVWMGSSKANDSDTEFVNKHASAERIAALRRAVGSVGIGDGGGALRQRLQSQTG